jgi:hypothetical protein
MLLARKVFDADGACLGYGRVLARFLDSKQCGRYPLQVKQLEQTV